jgi:uncharacterized protein (DUF1499 family)
VNTPAPQLSPPRWLTVARALVMAAAVAAFVMLVFAGPGTRMGLWPWQTGLALLTWAAYTGLAAGAGALVLIVLLALPRWRSRPWIPVAALVIAIVAVAPPMMLLRKAEGLPPIHDITTDPYDPPVFQALMPERLKAPNGAAYGGLEIAKQQQKGYPDIHTLILKAPPSETVQRAIDAARACGWEIVSSDAASGRIEATATSAWFGFKDDIVVRVRPEGSGSRLDVRSVSRVGQSDLGANAARLREFLKRLT